MDHVHILCRYLLLFANIGDAKAVVARSAAVVDPEGNSGKSQLKAIVLTREHKAIYPQERARIQKVPIVCYHDFPFLLYMSMLSLSYSLSIVEVC